MKIILGFLVLASTAFASEVPSTPPSACYGGCTPLQEKLVKEFFEVGVEPEKSPAVYSGVCHHAGMYDPEIEHHSVVLLDNVNGARNFSTIFSWFEYENSFKDWTLETARTEMSPYWLEHGKVTVADQTARTVISDNEGYPVYVYWMRQNPKTKELLYITYMGSVNRAFCRLQKHGK